MSLSLESQARVAALREYLATAPQEVLDARLARVNAKNLPEGPSASEFLRGFHPEYVREPELKLYDTHVVGAGRVMTDNSANVYYFTDVLGNVNLLDPSVVGDYSYAMAA